MTNVINFEDMQQRKAREHEEMMLVKFLREVYLPGATIEERERLLTAFEEDNTEYIAEVLSVAARKHYMITVNKGLNQN